MTPKEAIEELRFLKPKDQDYAFGGLSNASGLAVEMAIEALEKQIPKKPINQSEEYDRTYGNCPCCGEMVVDYPDDFRVCSNCGQRLDWSEEE